MAINFPSTPTDGDSFSGYIWVESENAWRRLPIDAYTVLDNLNDVDINNPADGEVLAYDSASGEWVNQELILTLEGLSDTDIDEPLDREVLVYDSSSGSWINETIEIPELDDLPDVNVSTSSSEDVLVFDGTNWIPGQRATTGKAIAMAIVFG
jgi:hypothetical protein